MPIRFAAASHLLDLAWPSSCAGCGAWGGAWCPRCAAQTPPAPFEVDVLADVGVRVVAATPFEGPIRVAVTEFKDGGRTDLSAPLARLLRVACAEALRGALTSRTPRWHVAPVPSSRAARRQRGRNPLEELAATLQGPCIGRGISLKPLRRTADQSRLGREERARNLDGAFTAARSQEVGKCDGVLIVDDVVTSGATLRAAVSAVRKVTTGPIVTATVAATPLRNARNTSGENLVKTLPGG